MSQLLTLLSLFTFSIVYINTINQKTCTLISILRLMKLSIHNFTETRRVVYKIRVLKALRVPTYPSCEVFLKQILILHTEYYLCKQDNGCMVPLFVCFLYQSVPLDHPGLPVSSGFCCLDRALYINLLESPVQLLGEHTRNSPHRVNSSHCVPL